MSAGSPNGYSVVGSLPRQRRIFSNLPDTVAGTQPAPVEAKQICRKFLD